MLLYYFTLQFPDTIVALYCDGLKLLQGELGSPIHVFIRCHFGHPILQIWIRGFKIWIKHRLISILFEDPGVTLPITYLDAGGLNVQDMNEIMLNALLGLELNKNNKSISRRDAITQSWCIGDRLRTNFQTQMT